MQGFWEDLYDRETLMEVGMDLFDEMHSVSFYQKIFCNVGFWSDYFIGL